VKYAENYKRSVVKDDFAVGGYKGLDVKCAVAHGQIRNWDGHKKLISSSAYLAAQNVLRSL
jgi:hypothetical protein